MHPWRVYESSPQYIYDYRRHQQPLRFDHDESLLDRKFPSTREEQIRASKETLFLLHLLSSLIGRKISLCTPHNKALPRVTGEGADITASAVTMTTSEGVL